MVLVSNVDEMISITTMLTCWIISRARLHVRDELTFGLNGIQPTNQPLAFCGTSHPSSCVPCAHHISGGDSVLDCIAFEFVLIYLDEIVTKTQNIYDASRRIYISSANNNCEKKTLNLV